MAVMEQLIDIAFAVFDFLLAIGVYLTTNPVQALMSFAGLLIVIFITVIVWRVFLSFKVLLIAILGIGVIAATGLYILNDTNLFGEDGKNTDTFEVTDFVDPELIKKLEQSHDLMHTHVETETVTLVDSGRARSLRNQSYLQGIGFLRQQAASFSGEYLYIYRTDFDGTSYWTDGIKVSGLTADYRNLLNDNLDAESLIIVHTHPDGSLGNGSHRMPPSMLDIIGGIQLEENLSIPLKHVVVESDRLWEYDFSGQNLSRIRNKLEAYIREVAEELEPVYACELVKPNQNCDDVSDRDRSNAIKRLLNIYRDMGIQITERELISA